MAYHAIAAAFVVVCCVLAMRAPDFYGDAMQEDRGVEWATMLAFACAGVAGLLRAVQQRRVFDGLVGLFLLFVAGEEMSWGQRLLGLTPPAYFLEHNAQQEMNLHNFANSLGGPRWPFVIVLAGYAIVLPLASYVVARRSPLVARMLERIGATPPPRAAIPWFVVAIALFIWYPFRFTGEWTELLSGSAFVVSMGLGSAALAAVAAGGVVAAAALTMLSSSGRNDPALVQCARREIAAISSALDATVLGDREAHRRLWALIQDGRVDADTLRARLAAVTCEGVADSGPRRRFAADPWGTAYWLRIDRSGAGVVTTLYSFGPNRRRDLDSRAVTLRDVGDDLFSRRRLPPR
jgi:hypothetical protein